MMDGINRKLLVAKLINTRIRLNATEAWLKQNHPKLFKEQQKLAEKAVNDNLKALREQNLSYSH
jgi:hypothetical protein